MGNEEKGLATEESGKSVVGSRNGKCKGPEVGYTLTCLE